ncbi:MAG: hypothetical protein CMJ78_20240 [Planctomycetaceae bacterium]|nr:hypothetical protein [Planctomycetaceae bacterium]
MSVAPPEPRFGDDNAAVCQNQHAGCAQPSVVCPGQFAFFGAETPKNVSEQTLEACAPSRGLFSLFNFASKQ